jgi:hypothetical protein
VRLSQIAAAANNDWCSTVKQVQITVASSRFALALPHPNVPGNPTIEFDAYVIPDGSFQATSNNGGALLTGRVADNALDAYISGAGCEYEVVTRKG